MKNVNKQLTEIQKLHIETTLRVMEICDNVELAYRHVGGVVEINTKSIDHFVDIAAHIIGAVESYGDQRCE